MFYTSDFDIFHLDYRLQANNALNHFFSEELKHYLFPNLFTIKKQFVYTLEQNAAHLF